METGRTLITQLGLLGAGAALALALASCSTGADIPGAPAQSAAGGSSGVPEVVQPLDARALVHEALAGKRIAFVPIAYAGYKLTTQWGSHMERAFSSMGATFTVFDSNFDTDLMVRTIDDLIAGKKADVLILHNPDVGVLSQQIERAEAAGIYTVVVNMISNRSGDAFIGADVVSAAHDVAERAVADCKAKGKNKVAFIEGVGPDGFSLQFAAGAKPPLEAAGIEIVDTVQSNWQATTANELATTLLQQHGKELCAFMLPWDVIAVGAGSAVASAEEEGRIAKGSIGVYSLDASADWCDSLRLGHVTASAAYDVPGIGTGAVLATQQLLVVGDPPGTRRTVAYVPYVVVDGSNVDAIASACYAGS
jgi:ribose transport system substrate-binding protein